MNQAGGTYHLADFWPRMIEEPIAKPESASKAELRSGIRLANLAQKGYSC